MEAFNLMLDQPFLYSSLYPVEVDNFDGHKLSLIIKKVPVIECLALKTLLQKPLPRSCYLSITYEPISTRCSGLLGFCSLGMPYKRCLKREGCCSDLSWGSELLLSVLFIFFYCRFRLNY